ncbi:hypothetical protein D3C71_1477780 [compost metagenome]
MQRRACLVRIVSRQARHRCVAFEDVLQQIQHAGHRVIVEGDLVPIQRALRVVLRPAAVGILRGQQVIHAALRGAEISAVAGVTPCLQQVTDFAGGGLVVDVGVVDTIRRLQRRALTGAEHVRVVHRPALVLLGPTAGRGLQQQHVFGDRLGACGLRV